MCLCTLLFSEGVEIRRGGGCCKSKRIRRNAEVQGWSSICTTFRVRQHHRFHDNKVPKTAFDRTGTWCWGSSDSRWNLQWYLAACILPWCSIINSSFILKLASLSLCFSLLLAGIVSYALHPFVSSFSVLDFSFQFLNKISLFPSWLYVHYNYVTTNHGI